MTLTSHLSYNEYCIVMDGSLSLIDLNDFKHKLTSCREKSVKNKVYRHYCNNCGVDKGYLQKSHNTPFCNKCASLRKLVDISTRIKMSESAIRCYNDPAWSPKSKGRGYSVDDLIANLKAKFKPGMSWDNYGINGWEIDHVVPDSCFQYSSTQDKEFKESWSLNNLQPEWANIDRSKGARYACSRQS